MSYQTVPYSFTSGTTAIAAQWNSNYSALISGLTDGTKDLNLQSLTVANFNVTGKLYSSDLSEISSTISFAGFSSFSTRLVYCKYIGKTIYIYYQLIGNSDGTGTVSMTFPFSFNIYTTFPIINMEYVGGNQWYVGAAQCEGSNIVVLYKKGDPLTNWLSTAGSSKESIGQFILFSN